MPGKLTAAHTKVACPLIATVTSADQKHVRAINRAFRANGLTAVYTIRKLQKALSNRQYRQKRKARGDTAGATAQLKMVAQAKRDLEWLRTTISPDPYTATWARLRAAGVHRIIPPMY